MRTKLKVLFFAAAVFWMPSCVTYTGVARYEDKVYLTGTTSYLIFSEVWVKRCTEGKVMHNTYPAWSNETVATWRPGLRCVELIAITGEEEEEEGVARPAATPTTTPSRGVPMPRAVQEQPAATPVREQPKPAAPLPDPFIVAVPFECAEWIELLCGCNARDIAVRDKVCQQTRSTARKYASGTEKDEVCKDIVRGMFTIATCDPPP